ncbi:MAG: hypothetical protein [Bacteriophage sp.]|nr:MAG: hypothetical protein [Bacteriophage sp.]
MISIEEIEFHTTTEAKFIALLPRGCSQSTITVNDADLFITEISRVTGIDTILIREKVTSLYGQLPATSLI